MAQQKTSRYRGVSWDPSRGLWKVQIASAARGWRYSSRFDEEGAAARGYDHLARVLLGDEAVLNFPGEPMCEADRAWVDGVIHQKAGAARAERGRKRKADKARRSGEAKAKREAFEERKAQEAAARAAEAAIPKMGRHEACERFGVSLNTWQRWEREGQVTCGYRVGGRKMYPVAEIERLVERHGVMRPPYEDSDRPGVWRVVLNGKDMHREEALVDAASLKLLEGATLSAGNGGDGRFVSLHRTGTDETVPLRRLIMGVSERGQQVGHRNGDPLDCRRENLVVRTVSQRVRNRGKTKALGGKQTTSRFKGVCFESQTRQWRASIRMDGDDVRLGRYRDEEAAARAYDEAAREHFGVHARVNFPKEGEDGVVLNQEAALPEGMAVAPSEAEREAERVAEEAARREAGWVKQVEVRQMFEVSAAVWTRWKQDGKVSKGVRPRVPGAVWYERAEVDRWLEAFGPIGEPYADPERADCWWVPLTTWASRRSENRREVLIDAASLPIVRGRRWGWNEDAQGDGGRVVLSDAEDGTSLARLVLGLEDTKRFVIYLNRDPLDCRRVNLQARSRSVVGQRSRKMGSLSGRKYTSEYKGVCWHKAAGMWFMQIKKDRKCRFRGFFKSEVAAARAYDNAAIKLFGPQAYFNFPERLGLHRAA